MDESHTHSTPGEYRTCEILGVPSPLWSLEVADGGARRRWTLAEGESVSLGASSRSGMRIDDLAVSSVHGEVGVQGGRLWVRDAGSRNGVHVAGARVREAIFDRDGCFVVGRTLLVVGPASGEEAPVEEEPLEGVVGRSQAMLALAREVRRFAGLRAPVLIRGETGVGKELIAGALHQLSARRGPLVPFNMGALSGELVDSELFGHEKGSFTGAMAARQGAFESAQKGTLFLDEVAEMPLSVQARLLRTLENGEIKPVGVAQPRKIDVRVVAASWASLPEQVAQGRFREDLFHRLAVLTLDVPPLRERIGDLGLLARRFLGDMAPEVGEKSLTSGALSRLSTHRWPGNIRELKNVLLRAAVGVPGRSISTGDVELALVPFRAPPMQDRKEDAQVVLEQHSGNKSSAARALGVARSTFRGWVGKR